MKEAIASPKQSHSAVRHNTDSRSTRNYAVMPRKKVTFCDAPLLFPGNGVWGSSVEIPYWWRVTTQIWVVFVIGWSEFWTTQKNYPDLGGDTSSVWNSCPHSSLRRHFAGKLWPAVASRNFGCFLRLIRSYKWLQSTFSFHCWSMSFSVRHFLCLYISGHFVPILTAMQARFKESWLHMYRKRLWFPIAAKAIGKINYLFCSKCRQSLRCRSWRLAWCGSRG